MTASAQTKAFAKSLLSICLENGSLSDERVSAVLAALEKNPPRHYVATLKAFLRLVEAEVAKRTASVEFAGPELSSAAAESIRASLSAAYGRPVEVQARRNEDLIAGLRVRIGCDVYDASVAGTLNQLQESLS